MKLPCVLFKVKLSMLYDEELKGLWKTLTLNHVRFCQSCKKTLTAYQAISDIASIDKNKMPPLNWDLIENRLAFTSEDEPSVHPVNHRHFFKPVILSSIAAAFLLAVSTVIFKHSENGENSVQNIAGGTEVSDILLTGQDLYPIIDKMMTAEIAGTILETDWTEYNS